MFESFQQDKDPRKTNLGIGAYKDESNSPIVLKSVKKVPNNNKINLKG